MPAQGHPHGPDLGVEVQIHLVLEDGRLVRGQVPQQLADLPQFPCLPGVRGPDRRPRPPPDQARLVQPVADGLGADPHPPDPQQQQDHRPTLWHPSLRRATMRFHLGIAMPTPAPPQPPIAKPHRRAIVAAVWAMVLAGLALGAWYVSVARREFCADRTARMNTTTGASSGVAIAAGQRGLNPSAAATQLGTTLIWVAGGHSWSLYEAQNPAPDPDGRHGVLLLTFVNGGLDRAAEVPDWKVEPAIAGRLAFAEMVLRGGVRWGWIPWIACALAAFRQRGQLVAVHSTFLVAAVWGSCAALELVADVPGWPVGPITPLAVAVLPLYALPLSSLVAMLVWLSLREAKPVGRMVEDPDLPPHWKPDWRFAGTADLFCPLCGYNLRGLDRPLCPECGHEFNWRQLVVDLRTRHPFLFEHNSAKPVRYFLRTVYGSLRSGRFWRSVQPFHRVNPVPLVYFALLCAVFAAAPALSDPAWWPPQVSLNTVWRANISAPDNPFLSPITEPLFTGFLAILNLHWTVAALSWPVLTLMQVLIFRVSLCRGDTRMPHVARAVTYAWAGVCVPMALLLNMLCLTRWACIFLQPAIWAQNYIADSNGWILVGCTLLLGPLATWRFARACRLYLRIDHAAMVAISTLLITTVIWGWILVKWG
jgi:hypothetical protein